MTLDNTYIKQAYKYLFVNDLVSSQNDVAELMGANTSNVSQAMNGNARYLTQGFISRFNKTFGYIFNEHWLLTGEGQMLASSSPSDANEQRTKRIERINAMYEYLRSKGQIHTQKDLAERIGAKPPVISAAMKGKNRCLTDNLFLRINNAFDGIFNETWLLTGQGDMLKKVDAARTEVQQTQTQMGTYNKIINNSHSEVVAPSPTLLRDDTKNEMPMPQTSQDAVLLDLISRQTDVIQTLTKELTSLRMQLEQQSAKMREMESALGCIAAHAHLAHSQGTASEGHASELRSDEKSVG